MRVREGEGEREDRGRGRERGSRRWRGRGEGEGWSSGWEKGVRYRRGKEESGVAGLIVNKPCTMYYVVMYCSHKRRKLS